MKQVVSPERVKQVAGLKTTLRASRESFRVLSEGFESSEVPHQPSLPPSLSPSLPPSLSPPLALTLE